MFNRLFSNDGMTALIKGLDAAAIRQQVIANNVANINTPGYKRQEVSFEEEFSKAVANKNEASLIQTDPMHLPGNSIDSVVARVFTDNATSLRYDGNNVDIDEEMAKLAENNIRFQAMSKLLGEKFNGLKMVINGGR